MKAFNKILVPYDFSAYAEAALEHATLLSGGNTIITVLHITEVPFVYDTIGMVNYQDHKEIEKTVQIELEKLIADLQIWHPTLKFETKLIMNETPADAIITTQLEGKHEIIVMGSHGRKGLERLLMGSVSESVMRNAICPVMIIKSKSN